MNTLPSVFDRPLEFVGFLLGGLLVTTSFGWLVKRVMDRATGGIDLSPPFGVSAEQWKKVTELPSESAGKWLGGLERLLFFLGIWFDASAIIVGWLAFKVATKWEVWQNLIQVPVSMKGIDEVEYLAARRRWASHIFMRFLVGTIGNLLAAALAVLAARLIVMAIARV